MVESKNELRIAIIMTVFNRREKTIRCLDTLQQVWEAELSAPYIEVFVTNDGCTDGTPDAIVRQGYKFPINILEGSGDLYWLGGMNKAWRAAIDRGGFDGYLWLNDDTAILPGLFSMIREAEEYSLATYKSRGIYVGSTCDPYTGKFTYGGFDYVNKWTLKDRFVIPDGNCIQACECAHGNITYVSNDVVQRMGVFYDGYIHGAGDHDYTYQAHKQGFPILVMKNYAGYCENDHIGKGKRLEDMTFRQRLHYLKSPLGLNFHNTLLFQRRNFWYRYPFVWLTGIGKLFFPSFSMWFYLFLRK